MALGDALPAAMPRSTGTIVSVTPSNFQSAMNAATAGQRLQLATGTYGTQASKWVMSNSGTSGAPITIMPAPGASPVIKGQLKIAAQFVIVSGLHHQGPAPTAADTLIWINSNNIEISSAEIDTSYARSAVFIDNNAGSWRIVNNYFHDNGIFDQTNDPINAEANVNLDHHIYCDTASSGLIADNIFYRSRAFGIQIYPGPISNVIVTNNVIDTSGNCGMVIDGSTGTVASVRVTGNIISYSNQFAGSGSVQVGSGPVDSTCSIRNNLLTENIDDRIGITKSGNVVALGGPVGYVGGTAGSVGSYAITSGSAARGLAEISYSMTTDYVGNARDATAPDAGAYEYVTSGTAYTDANTASLKFSASGVEAPLTSYSDTGQLGLSLTPSSVETYVVPTTVIVPVADVVKGNWTNEVGTSTNLFSSIDETDAAPNDADYVESGLGPQSLDTLIVRLAGTTAPASRTNHTVNFRYLKDSQNGKRINLIVSVLLADAATVVKQVVFDDIQSNVLAGSIPLSVAEATTIPSADYVTGLCLRFDAIQMDENPFLIPALAIPGVSWS